MLCGRKRCGYFNISYSKYENTVDDVIRKQTKINKFIEGEFWGIFKRLFGIF